MRIALVTPELEGGGIAAYTRTLGQGLADIGHAVLILAPGLPGPAPRPPEPGECLLRGLGTPEIRLGRRWWSNLGRAVLFGRAVAAACERMDAHLDVVEAPEWDAPGLLLATRGTLPVVTRLHGHLRLIRKLNGDRFRAEDRLQSARERAAIRRATFCAANSAYLAYRSAADHGIEGDRIAVLPLGVDIGRFRPGDAPAAREALGLPQGVPIVGFAGRLEARKGIDLLVAAWHHVRREHPAAVLAIAGGVPGVAQPVDGDAIRDLRLAVPPGHLKYLGPLPIDRMPDFYRAVDLVAVPSTGEPFGLVVLEALASGRPVVAAASGGIPEILDDGQQGFLVPPDDGDALAAGLARLLAHDLVRIKLGEAGRALAIASFSSRRQAQRTVEAYDIARRAWAASKGIAGTRRPGAR